MNKLFFFAFLGLTAHCGGTVATAPTNPGAKVEEPPSDWKETASCDAIKASCTASPAIFVKGRASGLLGLDGARVDFAVRYIQEEGMGLDVPHGVALGRTRVKGEAFETCVCVPRGGNMYPQIAAVVYAPGTKTESVADVARASFSQRYATRDEEDVGSALGRVPTDVQKSAAVAGMSDRTAAVTIANLPSFEGKRFVAGLVADQRPFAAQLASGGVEGGKIALKWDMPGRAYASEKVAFFVDRNANGKCDAADAGGFAPFATSIDFAGTVLDGSAITPVCDAIEPDASRE